MIILTPNVVVLWLCSTQKTKPGTTRVLRRTIPVWTWFLQIYWKVFLFLAYQTHHRPFPLGIKNRKSGYNHYLTCRRTSARRRGNYFVSPFSYEYEVQYSWILQIVWSCNSERVVENEPPSSYIPNKSSINCKIKLKYSFWSPHWVSISSLR
jgi:hypothetical protein